MRSSSDYKSENRQDRRRKKMGHTPKKGMEAQWNGKRKSALKAEKELGGLLR